MFKVETRPTTERYCPNGHEPLQDNSAKFCHLCGSPPIIQETTYDAALCANCHKVVDPTWDYCPYCGQGREEGSNHAFSEPVEEKTPDDVTEDDMPDIDAVFRVCFHFWQMPSIELPGQLGYKTMLDLMASGISPWEVWLTIKDIKQPKKE